MAPKDPFDEQPIALDNPDQTEEIDQLRLEVDNLTFQFDEIMEKLEQLTNMVGTLMPSAMPEMHEVEFPKPYVGLWGDSTGAVQALAGGLQDAGLDPTKFLRIPSNDDKD